MNWSLPQRETTLVTSAACSLLAFGKWLYFVLIWQQLISATPVLASLSAPWAAAVG